jgi:hypothetical protein
LISNGQPLQARARAASGTILLYASENITVQAVPEPSVTALLALGAIVFVYGIWRRRSSNALQPVVRS